MEGYLVPTAGGKPVRLKNSPTYIGRKQPANCGQDQSNEESGRLCKFEFADGQWHLTKLDESLDLKVNDHPVKKFALEPGDIVSIGKSRYRLDEACAGNTKEPDTESVSHQGSLWSRLGFKPKKNSDEPGGAPILGVLIPRGGGKVFPLRQQRNTVGRGKSCHIVIPQSTISELHCGLEFLQGYWRVVDLGSRNGVMVNGVPYKRRWVLPDDILLIGFVSFRIEYSPQGEMPSSDQNEFDTSRSLTGSVGMSENEISRLSRTEQQDPPH